MQIKPVILDGLLMYKVKDVFTALGLTDYRRQLGNLTPDEYVEDFNALTLQGMLRVVFASHATVATAVQAEVAKALAVIQLEALQPSAIAAPYQAPQPVESHHEPEPPKPKRGTATPVMSVNPEIQQVLDVLKANAKPEHMDEPYLGRARRAIWEVEDSFQKHIETYDMPELVWFTAQMDQLNVAQGKLDRQHPDQDPRTCWSSLVEDLLAELRPRRDKEIDWNKAVKMYRLPGLPRPKKESF